MHDCPIVDTGADGVEPGIVIAEAPAQALVDEKTEAMRSTSPQTFAALADFYDSLKPEQQQKLRDFMNKGGRHGWRS